MYLKRSGPLFGFLLRHFVASIVTIVLPIVIITFIYFILLLVAIIWDFPLGSPVVLPLSILAAFVISLIYTLVFLFPAVWFSELISKRLKWSRFTQIFLSNVILFALVHLIFGTLQLLPVYENTTWLQFADQPLISSIFLALPLGLYWWSAKAIELSTWGVCSLWRKLFNRNKRDPAV